jgi:hypothetical protein
MSWGFFQSYGTRPGDSPQTSVGFARPQQRTIFARELNFPSVPQSVYVETTPIGASEPFANQQKKELQVEIGQDGESVQKKIQQGKGDTVIQGGGGAEEVIEAEKVTQPEVTDENDDTHIVRVNQAELDLLTRFRSSKRPSDEEEDSAKAEKIAKQSGDGEEEVLETKTADPVLEETTETADKVLKETETADQTADENKTASDVEKVQESEEEESEVIEEEEKYESSEDSDTSDGHYTDLLPGHSFSILW